MRVLVVNAGSSSLKLRLLGPDDRILLKNDLAAHQGRFDRDSLRASVSAIAHEVDAVGHRVVHGGTRFSGAIVIDDDVEQGLRELTELAPLHQPKSLAGIDAMSQLLPDIPAVA